MASKFGQVNLAGRWFHGRSSEHKRLSHHRLLVPIWNGQSCSILCAEWKNWIRYIEVYLGSYQTWCKCSWINSKKSLTIIAKKFIIDDWQGPKYASGILTFSIFFSCISSAVFLHKCFWNIWSFLGLNIAVHCSLQIVKQSWSSYSTSNADDIKSINNYGLMWKEKSLMFR